MLKEIVESVTNRDILKEIAKTVDTIIAVKADGSDLIVNGHSKGKQINFTLSGKIEDYSKFEKFWNQYSDKINTEIKRYSK